MSGETTAAAEPSSARLALTLGFFGLMAGVLIVAAYQWTLPIIEENNAQAIREAVYKVVPGATKMQKLALVDQALARVDERDPRAGIFAAYDDGGAFRGYAVIGEGPGFQDTIRLIYGYDPGKKTLTGMDVLESRETPGLGDKIYKDQKFVGAFNGLSPAPEVVATKPGTGSRPNELDAITGATISSKAVVKIVNGAHQAWAKSLPAQPPGLQEKAP